MAMSDKRILEAKKQGRIIIDPFKEENLATSSYDISLGEFFFREQHPKFNNNIFNPYDPVHVNRIWGEVNQAPLAKDILPCNTGSWTYANIAENDRVILLAPGETILGHTQEYIGGRYSITTMMKARSSMGRVFISVCHDAGWGDVGYTNRWTCEITNKSQYYHVPLLVGSRIGQLIFMETGEILNKDYTQTGNYQTTSDIEELKKNWTPDSMLPKVRK